MSLLKSILLLSTLAISLSVVYGRCSEGGEGDRGAYMPKPDSYTYEPLTDKHGRPNMFTFFVRECNLKAGNDEFTEEDDKHFDSTKFSHDKKQRVLDWKLGGSDKLGTTTIIALSKKAAKEYQEKVTDAVYNIFKEKEAPEEVMLHVNLLYPDDPQARRPHKLHYEISPNGRPYEEKGFTLEQHGDIDNERK